MLDKEKSTNKTENTMYDAQTINNFREYANIMVEILFTEKSNIVRIDKINTNFLVKSSYLCKDKGK